MQIGAHVRAAAKTLAIMVITYIVTNVLDAVVIVWELVDYASLSIEYSSFYDTAVRAVNVCVLFGCVTSCVVVIAADAPFACPFTSRSTKRCATSSTSCCTASTRRRGRQLRMK